MSVSAYQNISTQKEKHRSSPSSAKPHDPSTEKVKTLCKSLFSSISQCFESEGYLQPVRTDEGVALHNHGIQIKEPGALPLKDQDIELRISDAEKRVFHIPETTIKGRDSFNRHVIRNYTLLLENPEVLNLLASLKTLDENAAIEIHEKNGQAIFHVKNPGSYDFTFTYQFTNPLTNLTQISDTHLPQISIEGDDAFTIQVLKDLSKLLQYPSSNELLSKLKSSSNKPLLICQAGSNCVDLKTSRKSRNYIININHDPVYMICRTPSGMNVIEKSDTAINLAHELTHVLHVQLGSLDMTPENTIFDNQEEKETIGTVDNVEKQKLTENAYRKEMGYLPRVGHIAIVGDKINSYDSKRFLTYGMTFIQSMRSIYRSAINDFWTSMPTVILEPVI